MNIRKSVTAGLAIVGAPVEEKTARRWMKGRTR